MKRIAILSIWAAAVFAANAAFGLPISQCQCSSGIDRDGRAIPVSETYCGYTICGTSNERWECAPSGWRKIGTCGTYPPECTAGRNQWGKPIDPNATYSGYTTAGVDYRELWSCGSGGWNRYSTTGSFCNSDWCHCYDGINSSGVAIPPSSTYCGYATLGTSFDKWQCTAGGWEKYANAGVATNNAKFGLNSAVFMSPSQEITDQSTAQSYRMGWYQMMIGDQAEETQIDWRVAAPIQNARNRGLTSILRLCTGSGYCNYQNHADRLVSILNSSYLQTAANGTFYVITGPNEPPTEKWMTPTTQAITPNCVINGATAYCDADLDTIAAEMANFADYVLTNTNASYRIPYGGRVGLLSPAWDCHNTLNTPRLMVKFQAQLQARGRSMASFDGVAINAYDLHGQKATNYISQCKGWLASATGTGAYNYYLTETGMLEVAPYQDNAPRALARDNLRELLKTLRGDSSIKAALLFNATGRSSDPNFEYDILRESCEWQYLLGGHAQL